MLAVLTNTVVYCVQIYNQRDPDDVVDHDSAEYSSILHLLGASQDDSNTCSIMVTVADETNTAFQRTWWYFSCLIIVLIAHKGTKIYLQV